MDPVWTEQTDEFEANVLAWTGNRCSLLEYTEDEYEALEAADDRIVASIAREGIALDVGVHRRVAAK